MKFTLQSEDKEDGTIITHEFESDVWYSALDQFVKFLRGSGYQLKDNSVGINLLAGHLFTEYLPLHNTTYFEQEQE